MQRCAFGFVSLLLTIPQSFAVRGGVKVKPHEFPFLAFFYDKGTWTRGCGGALISPKHVLSCRHCFDGPHSVIQDFKSVEVGFGKTLADDDEGVVKRKVLNIAFHSTVDFAILVLNAEVPLSEHVNT